MALLIRFKPLQVFYNQDPDRSNALERINNVRQRNPGIEFIGITLPSLSDVYDSNPFPGAISVPVTQERNHRPYLAPYLIHWTPNTNAQIYYIIVWNEHLRLNCGWTLEFNTVLNGLATP